MLLVEKPDNFDQLRKFEWCRIIGKAELHFGKLEIGFVELPLSFDLGIIEPFEIDFLNLDQWHRTDWLL